MKEIKTLLGKKQLAGTPNEVQEAWLQDHVPLWKVKGKDSAEEPRNTQHTHKIGLPLGRTLASFLGKSDTSVGWLECMIELAG